MRDSAFARAHLLQRYENALAELTTRELSKLRAQLTQLVKTWDYSQVGLGFRLRRYEALVAASQQTIAQAFQALGAQTRSELMRAAKVSAEDATRLLAESTRGRFAPEAFRIPSAEVMRGVLTENPVQGAIMGDWWKEQSRSLQKAFAREMRQAVVNGESVATAVRRVRGSRVGNRFVGGIMRTSVREARALVRTSFNQVYNGVAFATYQANRNVTKRYEYVATLDERTTDICRGYDGMRYAYDDPAAPRPPQHWNCRSTIVPLVDYEALGIPPQDESRLTYRQWIAGQPATVQDKVFGKGRAELLRTGKVELEELVRQDGRRVSLAELNRRLGAVAL